MAKKQVNELVHDQLTVKRWSISWFIMDEAIFQVDG